MDGAAADCSKAIELDRRLPGAYSMRAVIRWDKGDADGAAADFDKALALDTRNPNLFRVRGMLRLQKRDLADLDEAVALDPSLSSYEMRALVRFQKGDYDEAVEDLDKAVEKSQADAKLYNLRAQAKLRMKDWGGAAADYDAAVRLDPKFPDAYLFRGLVLLNQHKDAEAQKDFDKFLELAPDERAFVGELVEKTKRERAPAR